MNSEKTKEKTTTKTKKSFSHEELVQALYYIDDVLSRGSIPYFVIKETADSVMSGKDLYGEAIHIGVRKTDWESSAFNIINLVAEAVEMTSKLVEYEYLGVPIYINIFNKNHPCIESTNPIPYAMEYFYTPNPYTQFQKLYL